MYNLVRHTEPAPGASRTVRFDGDEHGSEVSFFLVDNEPGQGPALHVHPYTETWIVRAGEAEFMVGRDRMRAGPGDIVVGGAGVPHKFRNVGTGRLQLVCIHASARIIQEWVEEHDQPAA
ncbi:cupin 2 domain-containing protein [Mesorhizobium sp. L-8-10]|uniref:cupin domain-containing protein n=1 Tax=Mesorhizobium sp. L-8-10 TaxID=2744523 RepID=UPI001927AF28|nr:cupin domain-containing protein [Mesorhizobium sp. L-8-10]BCH34005.1 cupin 2 domain-containing protein [Mesorhizobium sp. L-8-10]